jgi:hypothetical protein
MHAVRSAEVESSLLQEWPLVQGRHHGHLQEVLEYELVVHFPSHVRWMSAQKRGCQSEKKKQ